MSSSNWNEMLRAVDKGNVVALKNTFTPEMLLQTDFQQRTLLTRAAVKGKLGVIRALVELKADVNQLGYNGDSALVSAIREGRRNKSVKLLASLGADLSGQLNPELLTPIETCALVANIDAAHILVSHDVQWPATSKMSIPPQFKALFKEMNSRTSDTVYDSLVSDMIIETPAKKKSPKSTSKQQQKRKKKRGDNIFGKQQSTISWNLSPRSNDSPTSPFSSQEPLNTPSSSQLSPLAPSKKRKSLVQITPTPSTPSNTTSSSSVPAATPPSATVASPLTKARAASTKQQARVFLEVENSPPVNIERPVSPVHEVSVAVKAASPEKIAPQITVTEVRSSPAKKTKKQETKTDDEHAAVVPSSKKAVGKKKKTGAKKKLNSKNAAAKRSPEKLQKKPRLSTEKCAHETCTKKADLDFASGRYCGPDCDRFFRDPDSKKPAVKCAWRECDKLVSGYISKRSGRQTVTTCSEGCKVLVVKTKALPKCPLYDPGETIDPDASSSSEEEEEEKGPPAVVVLAKPPFSVESLATMKIDLESTREAALSCIKQNNIGLLNQLIAHVGEETSHAMYRSRDGLGRNLLMNLARVQPSNNENDSLECFNMLVNTNTFSIDARDRAGASAVWHAAYSGRLAIVKALVEYKANVNLANNYGNPSLYAAIVRDHVDIAKYLLDQKADLHFADYDGTTALMVASKYSRDGQLAQMLLDRGACTDVELTNGDTARSLAQQHKNKHMLRALDSNLPWLQMCKEAVQAKSWDRFANLLRWHPVYFNTDEGDGYELSVYCAKNSQKATALIKVAADAAGEARARIQAENERIERVREEAYAAIEARSRAIEAEMDWDPVPEPPAISRRSSPRKSPRRSPRKRQRQETKDSIALEQRTIEERGSEQRAALQNMQRDRASKSM